MGTRGTGSRPTSWTVDISTALLAGAGHAKQTVFKRSAETPRTSTSRAVGLVITGPAPLAMSFPSCGINVFLERDTAGAGRVLAIIVETFPAALFGTARRVRPRVDAGEAEGEGEDEALEHIACGL